jgi:hypothetical protein
MKNLFLLKTLCLLCLFLSCGGNKTSHPETPDTTNVSKRSTDTLTSSSTVQNHIYADTMWSGKPVKMTWVAKKGLAITVGEDSTFMPIGDHQTRDHARILIYQDGKTVKNKVCFVNRNTAIFSVSDPMARPTLYGFTLLEDTIITFSNSEDNTIKESITGQCNYMLAVPGKNMVVFHSSVSWKETERGPQGTRDLFVFKITGSGFKESQVKAIDKKALEGIDDELYPYQNDSVYIAFYKKAYEKYVR